MTSGAGTLAAGTTTTGPGGQAQNTLTLGASAGAVVVTASALGKSVSFAVNNVTQAAMQGLASFAAMATWPC